jgi:hypothetical protein
MISRDSNVTGGEARYAKKSNRGNDEHSRQLHCSRLCHFVVAVWSTKQAQLKRATQSTCEQL